MQRRQQRARVPGLPYPHPHLHKPALTSNDTSESTNVPHKCPKCGPKPGAFIYKYSVQETTCDFLPEQTEQPEKIGIIRQKTAESSG